MKNIAMFSLVAAITTFSSAYPYAPFELREDSQLINRQLEILLHKCRTKTNTTQDEKEFEDIIRYYNITRKNAQYGCYNYTEQEKKDMLLQHLPTTKEADKTCEFCTSLVNTIEQMRADLQNREKPIYP